MSTNTKNEQRPPFPISQLHSRYQPQLEADRYIEALNLRHDMEYFILIEPGLGYLIPSVQKHHPESKIIVLHADSGFRETEGRCPDVPMWFPDSGTGVQEFLEEKIPETASVRIIEWRPSLRIFGDKCLELVRESTEFIKRSEASRRTGAVFGRRWVRNFFRNTALLNRTILYRTMDTPIVITGSGPSLEAALPQIRAVRERVFVMAASSSLPALAAGGIAPDMVISTDGGGWALLHLHACFRGEETPMLACTLSAAIPSQCSAIPLLPLNDGTVWQSMALRSLGIPSALIPQRGTVTASALELALLLSSGSIFLAGMDLAIPDIRSHARPYGFDYLFWGAASRLRPLYSQHFIRSCEIRAGGSHDVYAAWFKTRIASLSARIFSLGGNHAVLGNSLSQINTGGGRGGYKNFDHFKIMTLNGSAAERCNCAAETLIAALDDPQYAALLSGELAPLLFPLRTGVPAGEIAEELRSIAGRKHG
ncbi:MAG: DUF115 domain-containing protein [Treponema sp.]|nr:DUF115 domain-containing protein [Treponema sp.]